LEKLPPVADLNGFEQQINGMLIFNKMSRTGFTYSLLKCSVFAIIGKTTIYKLHKTHPFAFKIKIALMMISCCGFDEEKCAFPVRYVVCSDAPAHLFLLSFVVARYLLTFNSIPVCTLV